MERRLVLVLLAMAWTVVAGSALAADPPEIALLIEKGKFQPDEIKVKANAPFILVITNKGDKAAEFERKDPRRQLRRGDGRLRRRQRLWCVPSHDCRLD